jgi:hypothetical protein
VGTHSTRVLISAALLAAGSSLHAQRVRGTLTDSATRDPVRGAVVSLSDSGGRFLSRGLADENGRYSVPRVGHPVRLRVVRIGYRPRDIALAVADSIVDLRMAPIASVLDAVSSSAKRVCPGEQANAQALDVWEQARAGLLASVVSRESRSPRIRVRSYVKTIEPIKRRVIRDSNVTKEVVVERSYVAARPAWAFESDGYMRENAAKDREYFAPDDAVLLDPSFAATHCLRLVVGDSAHGGRTGIGFEPIDARMRDSLVDINGVLWLDATRHALQSLEFRYTNLERDARDSGGDIQFSVMPNGVAMVTRWSIRSAILAIDDDTPPSGVRKLPPPRPLRTNVRLLAYRETGGAVLSAEWTDGMKWHGDYPRLVGQVNTLGRTPVPRARVWLQGTQDTVTTRADGSFEFPYLYPGFYVVLASDSALAEQGISRTVPARVPLLQPGDAAYELPLHPRSEVLPLVCPAKSYKEGTGVLMAHVLNSDGTPAANANVEVTVEQLIIANDTISRPQVRRGTAGEDGRFVICGASMRRPLVVRATLGTDSVSVAIDQWTDEVASLTLYLRPAAATPPR